MKERTIYVTCPHCNTFMEVHSGNGKVVKSHKPEDLPKDQDKLTAQLNKIKSGQENREQTFEKLHKETSELHGKLDALFEKEIKRVKKTGEITPNPKPFDLD